VVIMNIQNMTTTEKLTSAYKSNTSLDLLRELAKDENKLVRGNVPSNPNVTDDILRDLSKDAQHTVRRKVAYRPNLPDDILRDLSKDSQWQIRREVAAKQNLPDDIMKDLVTDEDGVVRWEVAENPWISITVLVTLLEFEKNLKKPSLNVIQALYVNSKLPTFAKRVIETLYGEML